VQAAARALKEKGADLVAVDTNPIDAVWPDQPLPSDARLIVQPDALAGRSSAQKRAEIADWLSEKKADAAVLSALDSIAWAFNVRGADVDRTPVALAYAIVNADGTADLFTAPEKVSDAKCASISAMRCASIRARLLPVISPPLRASGSRSIPSAPSRRSSERSRSGRGERARAARSDDPAQGDQERGGNCRSSRRTGA
jgi:Xaa-Pro aminopeptidase